METESRQACVASLLALANSPAYQDRIDAGWGLARFAEVPEAQPALVNLVRDDNDTAVTYAITEALLRRFDALGLRLVATALATANLDHTDWIYPTISEVLGINSRDRDVAAEMCEPLTHSKDEEVRRGATHLLEEIKSISPVLISRSHDRAHPSAR